MIFSFLTVGGYFIAGENALSTAAMAVYGLPLGFPNTVIVDLTR
jgi:hypothetical protein